VSEAAVPKSVRKVNRERVHRLSTASVGGLRTPRNGSSMTH